MATYKQGFDAGYALGVEHGKSQSGHLDGGARALDASEALREARVQGMREGARIVQRTADVEMVVWGDWDEVKAELDAAIEAVRKGER